MAIRITRADGTWIGSMKGTRFIPNAEYDPEKDKHLIEGAQDGGGVPEERENGDADSEEAW